MRGLLTVLLPWAAGVAVVYAALLALTPIDDSDASFWRRSGGGRSDRIAEGARDKNHADKSYDGAETCCDEHPVGPLGHIPLGYKIVLGPPLIAVGLWIGFAALWESPNWGVAYSVLILFFGTSVSVLGLLIMVN